MSNTKISDNMRGSPFRAWDALDRLFNEAFSRSKTRPLSPDIQYPLPPRYAEPHPYAHAGATPYASNTPAFRYSNESLGFSGPDDQDIDDPFDRIWNEGLHSTRRSTVTKSRTMKRPNRVLEGSGSNSTSTSNDASSSGPSASSPPPLSPLESTKSPRAKKNKSKVTFRDSSDGKVVTATFELPGIKKSDVHVSFQSDKIVISWESVTTDERMEGDRLVRERKEKQYVRTLPLPEGTKVENVKASMDGRRLVLTYPKFRTDRRR